MVTTALAADVLICSSFILFDLLCARLIGFMKWVGEPWLIQGKQYWHQYRSSSFGVGGLPCGLWDLSSLTRDRTWALCSKNTES